MESQYLEEINKILGTKSIDKRAQDLIKLYFIGKLKSGKITTQELGKQIDTLCSRIPKVEFTTSNLVTAYSKEAGILTLNKRLLQEGRADEVIVPTFMKFESIINQENRRKFANNIEDLIQAGQIAEACFAPISDRLYKLCQMVQYTYGDIEYKVEELINDGVWRGICANCNEGLNNIIITGSNDYKKILQLANIYHGEIYTTECMQNSEFVGPFNNPEYQKKSARIISTISNIDNSNERDDEGVQNLIRRIQLFTGCTDAMIEQAKEPSAYTGDKRISEALQLTAKKAKTDINEELIVSKVQEMIDRKPEWDSRIKHLVIPFFIRSQKIYGWDLDEFQERINQLDSKIDIISFRAIENLDIMGRTAGNEIELNSKIFLNKKGEPAYPVSPALFHELGHITDENEREGILSKERLENIPLVETNFYEWTNTIFERLVSGRALYKKNDAMELTEAGYSALAPLGSMLASALGISELEFAHIKDKGKDYEQKLIDRIFPNGEGRESLSRIREIFDEYELDTFMSFGKKKANQKLANEMYIECLNLMKKRIEFETGVTDGTKTNPQVEEQHKKRQMFFLKKLNYNFKKASKTEGFRFSMSSIVHDIGFCSDKLPKADTLEVAREFVEEADFGFDNKDLGKYSKAMITSDMRKQEFNKSLQVAEVTPEHNQTLDATQVLTQNKSAGAQNQLPKQQATLQDVPSEDYNFTDYE